METVTKQILAPELRFPEFGGEWSKFNFNKDENLIHGDGDWILTDDISENEEIKIIQLGSIGTGVLVEKELKTISKKSFEKINGTYLNYGDILINRMVDNSLYCCLFDKKGEYVTSVDACWIRKSDFFDNKFIVNLLLTYNHQKDLLRLSSGSGRVRISKKNLFNRFFFNLPSLPEQQKIASFLTKVDDKVSQLTKKAELLDQYKKGVMQQIFTQQLRFKDYNGNEFPKWVKKRLGDLATTVKDKNSDNSINYVLTNSAIQGIVSQSDYFDKEVANQGNLDGYYIVDKDDFVYNPRVSVHAPVGPIKRNKLTKGVMSPLYTVFRFNDENLEFFEYYYETAYWHKYLVSVANIGARHDRMNILSGDFYNMPIPYPCDAERLKITSFLNNLSNKIEQVNTQLTQAKTWKKGLLQKMFV